MKKTELTFLSTNSAIYPKPITALIIEPDSIDAQTGAMLFTHGWSGNRFQHQDKMEWATERFNLIAISVEFRQSGYDFDGVTGRGSYLPYDASFYQVVDVLNGLRYVLQQRSYINRRRLFHYGGSQGGHVALLSTIYAPNTFAWAYASCPVTHLDAKFQKSSGRFFTSYELSARNLLEHSKEISCPVYLEYGTADKSVPHTTHGLPLETALRKAERLVHSTPYEGGGHDLQPTIDKLSAFQAMSERIDWQAEIVDTNDFEQGSRVQIVCGEKNLIIDWSLPPEDPDLLRWEDNS